VNIHPFIICSYKELMCINNALDGLSTK